MIKALDAAAGRLISFDPKAPACALDRLVWIDIDRPTVEEDQALEELLGINLPTADELKDIEPSSRLYRENGAIYMTANVVWRSATEEPETTPVSFILCNDRLITIRYSEPRSFVTFAAYAERHPETRTNGAHVMMGLIESIVDRTAEILERMGTEADAISTTVFRMKSRTTPQTSASLRELLARLALAHNLVSKARESLVSLGRMISFCSAVYDAKEDQQIREHVRSVSRDIQSLTDHASHLAQTTGFLQDAALGLINLEQNEIIKIFSVAAVMFLPPTLVASVYGMNFDVMPELRWVLGYPFAIVLMIFSAALPFWYFRRRGWL